MGKASQELQRLHWENPMWHASRLAREIGCSTAYVCVAIKRLGIDVSRVEPGTWGRYAPRIVSCHNEHPDWNASRIANEVGCQISQVTRLAARLGWFLPSGRNLSVAVPAWVERAELTEEYLEVAYDRGEEAAASHCRRLKAALTAPARELPSADDVRGILNPTREEV